MFAAVIIVCVPGFDLGRSGMFRCSVTNQRHKSYKVERPRAPFFLRRVWSWYRAPIRLRRRTLRQAEELGDANIANQALPLGCIRATQVSALLGVIPGLRLALVSFLVLDCAGSTRRGGRLPSPEPGKTTANSQSASTSAADAGDRQGRRGPVVRGVRRDVRLATAGRSPFFRPFDLQCVELTLG